MTSKASVVAVCASSRHGFSKVPQPSIRLVAGRGVAGDAHYGETVQHLYLKRRTPLASNRMQVHLLQAELFEELSSVGFDVRPGQMGENITTHGLDLLQLPLGARLHFEGGAVVELTGLRTPCKKIDDFQPGLLSHVLRRGDQEQVAAKAGVMGIVLCDGTVEPGAGIQWHCPMEPYRRLPMI